MTVDISESLDDGKSIITLVLSDEDAIVLSRKSELKDPNVSEDVPEGTIDEELTN